MISVELWRARIGTFKNKRCSGCSLFSLSSSSLSSSHCRRRYRGSTAGVSQEEPASTALTSPSSSSLAAEEQSQEFSSTDHHSVLTTSSTQLTLSCSTQSAYGGSGSFTASSFLQSSSSFFPTSDSLGRFLLRDAVIILLIAIVSQLLMIAGDIETNPGPKHGADDKPGLNDLLFMSYTGEDGRVTHFRLMDQLHPHWRRLAIALKFLPCDITVMKQEDDPVYYLLSEWLRGANQERDSRPVTWATLITALREANVQEEADILEKHFVEIELPIVPVTMSRVEKSHVPGKYFELIRHPSGGYTMRHGPIQVFVKPVVPEKLRGLLVEYANLLMILRRAELSEANFSDLKLYLSGYCSLESIEQCTSLRAVVDLLIKHLKIYMFNTHTLDVCCKYFNETIKRSVQEYKEHLDEFLLNTTIKEFMGTLQTEVVDRTDIASIALKLDESRVDDTLKALNTFLYCFFGNCSKALNHYDTGPGCVYITWLVSTSLIPTLRAMAEQHTLKCLVSQGILELLIGDLQIKVSNSLMDVREWPHQSHMQLYAFRKESDRQRKEFEEVLKKRSIECEQLRMKLKTTQKQNSEIEQRLEQLLLEIQETEGQLLSTMPLSVQKYSSAELRSFKKYYTDLLENIHHPVKLSKKLFSANLLSIYMLRAIRSLKKPVQQTVKLLDTVEIQIGLDPCKFDCFVDELEKDSPMQHLCDKLRSTCAQLKSQYMIRPSEVMVSSWGSLPPSRSAYVVYPSAPHKKYSSFVSSHPSSATEVVSSMSELGFRSRPYTSSAHKHSLAGAHSHSSTAHKHSLAGAHPHSSTAHKRRSVTAHLSAESSRFSGQLSPSSPSSGYVSSVTSSSQYSSSTSSPSISPTLIRSKSSPSLSPTSP